LERQWQRDRDDKLNMYAGLQVTLHAAYKKPGGGRWQAGDFVGKPKPKVPLVQRKQEIWQMLTDAAQINEVRNGKR
jgi:hypothetical protein